MYGATSLVSHFPRSQTPSVTAGLKCPPEICPPAKTITMSAEPIANGASAPAPFPMTVHPMVKTRKNVPTNSAMYLFMAGLPHPLDARSRDRSGRQGGRIVLLTCWLVDSKHLRPNSEKFTVIEVVVVGSVYQLVALAALVNRLKALTRLAP